MLTNLVAAMIVIESAGNPWLVGKAGELGVLQQTPAFLREVNRLYAIPLELQFRWPEDALDPEMATLACRMFLTHTASGMTWETKCRRYNGGPQGEWKRATKGYWRKIKQTLSENPEKRVEYETNILKAVGSNYAVQVLTTSDLVQHMIAHGMLTNIVNQLVAEGYVCAVIGHKWESGCGKVGCLVIHPDPIRHCVVCGKTETRKTEDWK